MLCCVILNPCKDLNAISESLGHNHSVGLLSLRQFPRFFAYHDPVCERFCDANRLFGKS